MRDVRVSSDHGRVGLLTACKSAAKVSAMHSKRTWWPVLSGFSLSALARLAIFLGIASAQNLPPSGAYQPIPNFTGVGAALQFHQAINDRMSGAQPILPMVVGPKLRQSSRRARWIVAPLQRLQARDAMRRRRRGAWARGNPRSMVVYDRRTRNESHRERQQDHRARQRHELRATPSRSVSPPAET